jgi:pimeloyl-ACP methyl ester carboxylesterase
MCSHLARTVCFVALLGSLFARPGAAQCNRSNGSPISSQNFDAYTIIGGVVFQSEGPTGTFVCTLNITVPRYQPVVLLRYQEVWGNASPSNPCMFGCGNTITATISGTGVSTDTQTLSDDGNTRPPNDEGTPWSLQNSVLGGETWVRTVIKTVDVSAATQSGDATVQFQITDVVPAGGFEGAVGGTFAVGGSMDILDPIPELQNGNQIFGDPDSLATLGAPVTGIAADGAARVVLRIRAVAPGQSITLSLLNDQGAVSSSAAADGTLATIDGTPASGQLQLTAVYTLEGPLAFAVYKPPIDFNRPGVDDSSPSRTVSFQVTSASGAPNLVTAPFTVWRPPVVLVHGLWGDVSDWNNFTPVITDSRFNDSQFSVRRANYNFSTSGAIANSTPGYVSMLLSRAHTNSLGFAFNAPFVLDEIQEAVQDFRRLRQAAATQADVVAHSMGGTIVRTLEYLPAFTDFSSFGVGNVHKLITIGTPHLGSPLAIQLIQDANSCIRNLFAEKGRFAFFDATVNGATVSGGAGDLQGDGSNDASLSTALNAIQPSNGHEVPTVMIAAVMVNPPNNPNNTGSLACSLPCTAAVVRSTCGGDPLADNLTPFGWPTVFSGQPSDAIVPLNSQVNGAPNPIQVNGVIHSSGLTDLDFTGPGELDSIGGASLIQTAVIGALNVSVQNSAFVRLP